MSLFSGPSWTQLHEMEHGGKMSCLSREETCLIWPGNFSNKR